MNIKRGTSLRFLGYVENKGYQIWVQTQDGLRGLIPQQSLSDTLIVGRALKNIAFGDTLILVAQGVNGSVTKVKNGKMAKER